MVLGHEIICRVLEVGAEVSRFKASEHVDYGTVRNVLMTAIGATRLQPVHGSA